MGTCSGRGAARDHAAARGRPQVRQERQDLTPCRPICPNHMPKTMMCSRTPREIQFRTRRASTVPPAVVKTEWHARSWLQTDIQPPETEGRLYQRANERTRGDALMLNLSKYEGLWSVSPFIRSLVLYPNKRHFGRDWEGLKLTRRRLTGDEVYGHQEYRNSVFCAAVPIKHSIQRGNPRIRTLLQGRAGRGVEPGRA